MYAAAQAKPTPSARTTREEVSALPDLSSALAEFERIYRGNVDVVMGYFARRCAEPQTVAVLTSEPFVRAAGGLGTFDPRRGTPRAWVFGIAANVYARHCADSANARETVIRLAGRRALVGELAANRTNIGLRSIPLLGSPLRRRRSQRVL